MFLIPNAVFHGSPDITIGLYVWKGVIPALLGNIVGGGFFVGTLYWYLHLEGQNEIAIDGHCYEPMTKVSRDLSRWVRKSEGKEMTEGKEHV